MNVAALYVDPVGGPYPRLGLDVYGWMDARQVSIFDRDARHYEGPHPVVAHPPCGPWGRFRRRYKGGEGSKDCGPRAVEQVRRWGGVLEHPAHSTLWAHCGLPTPGADPDEHGGWTLHIEQVDWGHPCKKPTWLYIVGTYEVPPMPLSLGGPTHCMVRVLRNPHDLPELPRRQRHLTPPMLAVWLVSVARRARRSQLPVAQTDDAVLHHSKLRSNDV